MGLTMMLCRVNRVLCRAELSANRCGTRLVQGVQGVQPLSRVRACMYAGGVRFVLHFLAHVYTPCTLCTPCDVYNIKDFFRFLGMHKTLHTLHMGDDAVGWSQSLPFRCFECETKHYPLLLDKKLFLRGCVDA